MFINNHQSKIKKHKLKIKFTDDGNQRLSISLVTK